MKTNGNSHEWWAALRHGGVLITEALLDEFIEPAAPVSERRAERLREAWLRFAAKSVAKPGERRSELARWAEAVLEEYLQLVGWQKGPNVSAQFKAQSTTGESLRPDRILVDDDANGVLAVRFDDANKIGVGKGRREHARTVELLRATGVPLAILTNGQQFRLIHAGGDYDA